MTVLCSQRTMPAIKRQHIDTSESMVNWWGFVLSRWCHLLVLSLWLVQARGQDCEFPGTLGFDLKETDPAGTELFNVSSQNESKVFTYTTQEGWLTDFLNLTLYETDLFYRMQLNKPLDLEEIYYNLSVTDISGFLFTLHCKSLTDRRRDYLIIVEAVNEWSPEFNTTSIHLSVKETLPMRSVVINLTQWSSDKDVHPISREIAGYSFLGYTGDPQIDGRAWLDMLIAYDGIVVIGKELDYEALPQDKKYVLLGVQVTDQGGKSGTASLTVYVEDDDDLPPVFTYSGCWQPCRVTYSLSVSPNFTGLVPDIKPAPIEAHDGDTLNYTVTYYIVQGPEHYEHYIYMDNEMGHLFILQELHATGLSTLVLIVEAREVSQNARATITTLLISVQDGSQEATVILSSVDSDDTVIIVSVILGAAVIIVIVLLIMLVYTKKRSWKSVFPEKSVNSVPDHKGTLSGIDHQTSPTSHTSKDIHAHKTGSSTILDYKDYGYADIEPPSTVDGQKTDVLLQTQRHNGSPSWRRGPLNESPTSDLVVAFDGDHVDHLATMPENQRDVINSRQINTGTEVVHLATNDQDSRESKAHIRPSLQIVSGLKAHEKSQDRTDPCATFDQKEEHPSGAGSSETDPAGLISDIKPVLKSGPKRKKSSRKRNPTLHDQDDSIYGGADIMENVEFDSGFYTDSTKTRIKRSAGKSVVIPDPDDIGYWLTARDDY